MWLGLPAAAWAITPVDVTSLPLRHDFSWFEVLSDNSSTLTLEEILEQPAAHRFVAANLKNINPGFSAASSWARFRVRFAAEPGSSLMLVLPKPLLDLVELYAVDENGTISKSVSGDALPSARRATSYRAHAFELRADTSTEKTYYLRVSSPYSASALTLSVMQPAAFERLVHHEGFFLGAFFGVMSALTFAAILMFLTSRNVVLLNYFFYVLSFTLCMSAVSGYGARMLWPQWLETAQWVPAFLAMATIVSGINFIRSLLRVRERWPLLDNVIIGAGATSGIGFLIALVAGWQIGVKIVICMAVLMCPLAFVTFVKSLVAGDRIVPYFMVGWFACVVGVAAAALDMLGYIPGSTFTHYGIYIGSCAEFVALAIALGAHLRYTQHEKELQVKTQSQMLIDFNRNLESMVAHRTEELEARNRELGEMAIRDSLTGLYNHSASIELLEQIMNQSLRYDFSVVVLMADIDHFKRINDNQGHQAGDQVLERVAKTMQNSLRDSDIVGRYGGEEFLIAMPHADALAGREYGERLLAEIREIAIPGATDEQLTLSIGIAVYNPMGPRFKPSDLIRRADEALYASKRNGRDRLTLDSVTVVTDLPLFDH